MAPKKAPKTSADDLALAEANNAKGGEAVQKGDYAGALAFYTTAVSLSEGSVAKYYSNRAQVHLFRNSPREASEDAAQALQLEPMNLKAAGRLAAALIELKKPAEALSVMYQMVARNPAALDEPSFFEAAEKTRRVVEGAAGGGGAGGGKGKKGKGGGGADDSSAPAVPATAGNGADAGPMSMFLKAPPKPIPADSFWVGFTRADAYGRIVAAYRLRTYCAFVQPPAAGKAAERAASVRAGTAPPQRVEEDFLDFAERVLKRVSPPSWWSTQRLLQTARADHTAEFVSDAPADERSHMCDDGAACWPIAVAEYAKIAGAGPNGKPRCLVADLTHIIAVMGDGTVGKVPADRYTKAAARSPEDDKIIATHKANFAAHKGKCPHCNGTAAAAAAVESGVEVVDSDEEEDAEEEDDDGEEEEDGEESEQASSSGEAPPLEDISGAPETPAATSGGKGGDKAAAAAAPKAAPKAAAKAADEDEQLPPLEDIEGPF